MSPYEQGTSFDLSARFHGGTGAMMLVRYNESPVGQSDLITALLPAEGVATKTQGSGPYDELLLVPGYFSFIAQGGETVYHHVITRIYVSTPDSIKNGRFNWGIPKHLANFQFSTPEDDKRSMHVAVSFPSSTATPFFKAILRDSRMTPLAMPISTSMIDSFLARKVTRGFSFQLAQPPLPDPTNANEASIKATAAGEELSWLVGTSKTLIVKPVSSGKAKMCWIVPDIADATGAFGDGNGFPQLKFLCGGRGSHLVSFDMEFPVPVELCSHQLGST
ncbi:hypothetical protein OIV83_005066 [Microbotryomycetes sp. JL201]|nr:hypothetical protein OIV83_005066 [Microbotryomycetes sp. JL201]